jgi:hypothetical protein
MEETKITGNTDFTDDVIPAPQPTTKEEDTPSTVSVNGMDVDAELIVSLINSTDKDGYSPCLVNASLERFTNIQPEKTLSDYTEDERTYIDGVDLSNCAINIHTFDGDLVNLILTFDSPKDSYLRELNELCNRYRIAADELTAKETDDAAVSLTITIVPKDLDGRAMVTLTLPTLFCRTLSDDGENASMLLQFHMGCVDFLAINVTDEEVTEITSDIMRQEEMGTNGQLFEE